MDQTSSATDTTIEVLEQLGVEVKRVTGDEIQCRCPDQIHTRFKGRPSTRHSFYLNTDKQTWLCFTCGARGTLNQLVSELIPNPADLWHIQSFMITSGVRRLSMDEAVYEKDVIPDITWASFAKFSNVPDRLLEGRRLTRDAVNLYGVRWDADKKCWIIPILSPLGEPKGWQEKKVGGYKNYPTGVHKGTSLFGYERTADNETVVLVESPLDVVRFYSATNKTMCVASFGANVSDEQVTMLSKFKTIVLALDNDKAGYKEMKRLRNQSLLGDMHLMYFPYPENRKDIGELTDFQIKVRMENLTSVPPF